MGRAKEITEQNKEALGGAKRLVRVKYAEIADDGSERKASENRERNCTPRTLAVELTTDKPVHIVLPFRGRSHDRAQRVCALACRLLAYVRYDKKKKDRKKERERVRERWRKKEYSLTRAQGYCHETMIRTPPHQGCCRVSRDYLYLHERRF